MTVVINGTTGISTPGLSNSSTTTNTGNVTNSGTVTNASTISVGNATPSASGAGITFPATQSASTDANTLDDYEEGSWTPTIYGSTGAGTTTYSSDRWGRYVKIGGWVYVQFCVNWTTSTGATGGVVIGGLPFTTSNFSSNHYPTAPIGFYNYGSSTGWGNLFQTGLAVPNSTTMYVYYSASNTMTAVGASVLNTGGGSLYMSTMYLAA